MLGSFRGPCNQSNDQHKVHSSVKASWVSPASLKSTTSSSEEPEPSASSALRTACSTICMAHVGMMSPPVDESARMHTQVVLTNSDAIPAGDLFQLEGICVLKQHQQNQAPRQETSPFQHGNPFSDADQYCAASILALKASPPTAQLSCDMFTQRNLLVACVSLQ